MPLNEPHPGRIRIVSLFDKKTREVAADSVPPAQQFVYVDAGGREVAHPKKAVDRIPIVESRMLSLDARGNLVAPEQAKLIRILEFGPKERLLRTTVSAK